MKKVLFAISVGCLFAGACATQSTGNVMSKMKTCLSEQGWQVVVDGTLYNNGMSATAKQISETCLNQLSLQDAGIDSQTTQMATTILTALSSAKQTQR